MGESMNGGFVIDRKDSDTHIFWEWSLNRQVDNLGRIVYTTGLREVGRHLYRKWDKFKQKFNDPTYVTVFPDNGYGFLFGEEDGQKKAVLFEYDPNEKDAAKRMFNNVGNKVDKDTRIIGIPEMLDFHIDY